MPAEPQERLLDESLTAEHEGRFADAARALRSAAAGPDPGLAADAGVRLGQLLLRLGPDRLPEAERVLREVHDRAAAEGLPRLAVQARLQLALLERLRGDPAAALARLNEQNLLAALNGPTGAEGARYFHYAALCHADLGDLPNAERLLFRAYQLYQEAGRADGLAEVCDSLANLLIRRGQPRPALLFAEQSLAAKRRRGDLYGQAITLGTVGRIRLVQARYAEAAAAFRADHELAGRLGDVRGAGVALNGLGEALRLGGDPAAAADAYRESLGADPGPVNAGHARLGLARIHLDAGRLADAAAELDAIDRLLAGNPGLRFLPDLAAGARGALAWRSGDVAGGERLLLAAGAGLRAQHADLGTIPLLFDLRDLYQHTGRTADAVRVMADALDVLHRCGSDQGVAEAERWLRTVDAPALTRLALGRYLPGHLIDGLLAGRLTDPPVQRMRVTVLFCDLRGFTGMSERLDPELVVELLNEWFGEAVRAVRAHGGVVDKFIGDAVMALFGVPDPRPESAADAVRAAVAMREAVAALNLRNRYLGRPELRIGIGVHSGEAVVGLVGSYLQKEFTAIGDAVNTASRVEGATKDLECDILLTQAARDAQEPFKAAEVVFRGRVPLKGKAEPVAVYEVRGLREAPPG